MNILFCYRNWMNPNKGGVQRVSDTLAKYFVSRGHELFYLTLESDANDGYQFPAKMYQLPDTDFFSDINIKYYHNLLSQLAIDIVINHDAANNRSRLFLNTGKYPAKKISLYHTDPLHELNRKSDLSGYIKNSFIRGLIIDNLSGLIQYLRTIKKKRQINILIKKSDILVVLSNEHKKRIFEELKINSSKIEAINNPVISPGEVDTDIKKKQLLFVARIEFSVKRPDKMLQIWSYLESKYPDWELLFLGDGPERNLLEEMARNLELKNVRFEGFVDPLPYYKEASILCMTSEYEGFPSVLPEAMQFGVVPVTFNNWSSLKDVITDQVTGILVKPNDLADFTAKLEQLLTNLTLRSYISSNAREFVKKFRIERIGPKWDALFNVLFLEEKDFSNQEAG